MCLPVLTRGCVARLVQSANTIWKKNTSSWKRALYFCPVAHPINKDREIASVFSGSQHSLSQCQEKQQAGQENRMDSDLSRFSVIVEEQFSIKESKIAEGRGLFVCVHSEVTSVQGDRDSLLWPLAAVDVPYSIFSVPSI